MTTFDDLWRHHYGDTPPLSFAIRDAFPESWIRFHALPHAQRYAQTDAERSEILRRANAIACETLGADKPCWLVQLGSPELGWPIDATDSWACYGLTHAGTYAFDELVWPAYATQAAFAPAAFDDLLIEIAEDSAFKTLWISEADGNVFAPYDSGFDVFMQSRDEIEQLRDKYCAWLSDRPDGL